MQHILTRVRLQTVRRHALLQRARLPTRKLTEDRRHIQRMARRTAVIANPLSAPARQRNIVRQARMRDREIVRRQPKTIRKLIDIRRLSRANNRPIAMILHHNPNHMLDLGCRRGGRCGDAEGHQQPDDDQEPPHCRSPRITPGERALGPGVPTALHCPSLCGKPRSASLFAEPNQLVPNFQIAPCAAQRANNGANVTGLRRECRTCSPAPGSSARKSFELDDRLSEARVSDRTLRVHISGLGAIDFLI